MHRITKVTSDPTSSREFGNFLGSNRLKQSRYYRYRTRNLDENESTIISRRSEMRERAGEIERVRRLNNNGFPSWLLHFSSLFFIHWHIIPHCIRPFLLLLLLPTAFHLLTTGRRIGRRHGGLSGLQVGKY